MKRVWGHVLAGLSVLTVGGATFFACVHNDSSIFIQDVLAPQSVSAGQQCVFTSTTTQPVLSNGVLDVLLRGSYDPEYLVGNQLVTEANSQQLVTETSTVTLKGAIVRLTDAQGNQLAKFTSLAAGTIYPAVSGVPSFAPISITRVIDSATIAAITDPAKASGQILAQGGHVRVVTYVRVFGQTLGGKYVESDEFEFPVDVCAGCLIAFTTADVNPAFPVPNCLGNPAAPGAGSQSSTCSPGQDVPIDCSQCLGLPVCHGAYLGSADAGPG